MMVTRLFCKLMIVLTVLVLLPIATIRSQPYDSSDLRAVFMPPTGCDAPCLLGIRPGETSATRAIRILNEHQWVQDVEMHYPPLVATARFISWRWNGENPAMLDNTQFGHMRLNTDNTIRDFTFPTRARLGDIWLWLGPPDREFAIGYRGVEPRANYILIYGENQLVLGFSRPCPLRSIWHSSVSVVAVDDVSLFKDYTAGYFPQQAYTTCRSLRR